ncbi:KAP family P-loop NTPase fold protein [Pseudomonas chlororaphis]
MEDQKDIWTDDYMGRKPSSDFLTNYLLANAYVKVLNVNSPWGAGKTFFLERWKAELSKKHVCVMFNAWATDYSAEPLVALVTCIEQQTKDSLDITASEAGRRAVDITSNILKKAAPLIAKGLVKKFAGVEVDDLLGKDGGDDASDAAGDLVKSLIEDQSKTTKHVEEFKLAVVERLAQTAQNNNLDKPAFIFIDELDRCRPTYAIELLERIKHFFELEDCRFVIASDSIQLAHSIKAVYGQDFSSERYLNRFFDAEFNLDNTNIFGLVHGCLPKIPSFKLGVNITGELDERNLRIERKSVRYPDKNTIISDIEGFSENSIILVGLCRYFKVELRELTNYIKQIKSAADTIAIEGDVHFFWLAYLVFFKASRAEEYSTLWVSEKGVSSIERYEENKSNVVTFSFTDHLASVSELASFYMKLITSNKRERNIMAQSVTGWRENIYYSLNSADKMKTLESYRGLVDLAYHLK